MGEGFNDLALPVDRQLGLFPELLPGLLTRFRWMEVAMAHPDNLFLGSAQK